MLGTELQPKSNVVLANYTTWRVGGPAQWFVEPETLAETHAALAWAHV